MQPPQLGGVVAVDGDHERAVGAVAGRHPGRGLEVGGERRPQRGRLEVQRQELVFAEVGLGDGRQHARGHRRSTASRLVAFEHDNAQPGLGCAPSRREPGDAGPYYGEIVSAVRLSLPSPALPGSGAGGRRRTAALSARSVPGSRRV